MPASYFKYNKDEEMDEFSEFKAHHKKQDKRRKNKVIKQQRSNKLAQHEDFNDYKY